MADLVTHACTALLPGAFVRSPLVPVVAVGTVLPDVFGRVVPMALEIAQRRGAPVPSELIWPWGALHAPVGIALWAAFLALCFVPGDRVRVFGALGLGGALHLMLDVAQDHHGRGYPLLGPLRWETFELGWIGSEATVAWALPLLTLTGVAWAVRGLGQRLELGEASRGRWLRVTAVLHLALPLGVAARAGWGPTAAAGPLLGLEAALALGWLAAWRWWRRAGEGGAWAGPRRGST